jgi:hypothetical protein
LVETTEEQVIYPGDIGLSRGTGLVCGLIRLGERIHHPTTACYWNHAFIFVEPTEGGDDWHIIQASAEGVEWSLASQRDTYCALDSQLDDRGRELAINFCVVMVGQKYGWVAITSIVLNLATPAWVQFNRPGTFICSGLVAHALEHGGLILPSNWEADEVMPADLAVLFNAPTEPDVEHAIETMRQGES